MKTIYNSILVLVLLCNTYISKAQNDYVIEYSTKDTCISTSISDYDNMLRHIIPDKKEITHLYKVNLIQLARQNLNFSFEHRIKPKLSLEHEATFHILNYYNFYSYYDYTTSPGRSFFDQFSSKSLYYLGLSSKLKYYHNIDSRTKRGKNTNGFSGNYFLTGFKINMAFYDTDLWYIRDDGRLSPYNSYSYAPKTSLYIMFNEIDYQESLGYINFGYGIQRRIGNVGFWSIEAKAGIGTNKYFDTIYIPLELNLKAGFALSSLTRKR
jgi:hypothetical protein